jgi:putative ATP-binding cassette transporter
VDLSVKKTSPAPAENSGKQPLKTTWRQFYQITKAFFASERRHKARGFLTALLSLALAVGAVQVLMSYAGRDFMTAISRKDPAAYWRALGWYLGTFAIAIPIGVYYRWVEERLALLWREWMAQHLLKRYFNNRAYYRLLDSTLVDNPDQRISEDVRNFTTSSLSFMLIFLNSGITLIAFIGVLWAISSTLVFTMILYAIVGTLVSILIGRKLVNLHFNQYKKEANFRYGLVRVRNNAESIAFYRGEKREHLDLFNRLTDAVANMRLVILRNRHLAFFTTGYNYIALILPVVIVAPMYMKGKVEFGVVTQAAGAFAQVLAAVSLIITQFQLLSAYLAGVQRLGTLWDLLDEQDAEETRISTEESKPENDNCKIVRLEKLGVQTPDKKKLLVKDLTFELHKGESILIMGASGAGKSSVLRTIAGLWYGANGLLERPASNQLMFLPQRPYMVEGSLRDQLLEKVNLSDILERVENDLDRVVDWRNILSLGEQQRVGFARLFLRSPRFAFLDEATSALDENNQTSLYQAVKESGIGYMSVGHRETLIPFHDRLLLLDKSGSWTLENEVSTQPEAGNESRVNHNEQPTQLGGDR